MSVLQPETRCPRNPGKPNDPLIFVSIDPDHQDVGFAGTRRTTSNRPVPSAISNASAHR
jgi:hypothetical protein